MHVSTGRFVIVFHSGTLGSTFWWGLSDRVRCRWHVSAVNLSLRVSFTTQTSGVGFQSSVFHGVSTEYVCMRCIAFILKRVLVTSFPSVLNVRTFLCSRCVVPCSCFSFNRYPSGDHSTRVDISRKSCGFS